MWRRPKRPEPAHVYLDEFHDTFHATLITTKDEPLVLNDRHGVIAYLHGKEAHVTVTRPAQCQSCKKMRLLEEEFLREEAGEES